MTADPLPLRRAHAEPPYPMRGLRRARGERRAERLAPAPAARPAGRAFAAEPSGSVPGSRTLTVDDFVRAAHGTSQPSTADVGPARRTRTQVRAEMALAAETRIAAAMPPSMDSAEAIEQEVRAPARIGAGSPLRALPRPAPHVVQGFGGEVDFEPDASPAAGARPSPDGPVLNAAYTTPAYTANAEEQKLALRAAAEIAAQPTVVPLYARDGRLLMPAPLKGSHDILVHQNQMADDAGLSRIRDDADLARMRRAHLLVDLNDSVSLRINDNLPADRRAARPWAAAFAADMARTYYAQFHEPLQLSSAVRTVAYQLRLQRVNGNAAAVEGEGASPHLTGQALDFGKHGMSQAEIAWMRSYLTPWIEAGKIDVEEEFQQACFHISVYSSYLPPGSATAWRREEQTQIAQAAERARTSALAATIEPDPR